MLTPDRRQSTLAVSLPLIPQQRLEHRLVLIVSESSAWPRDGRFGRSGMAISLQKHYFCPTTRLDTPIKLTSVASFETGV